MFTHFEPMAVELMMSIPDKSVGGQLDLLGYDTKADKIRLIDLKTKGNSKYDIRKRFKVNDGNRFFILKILICTGKNLTQLISNLVVTLKC